jgi:hypothetical protein
MGKSLNERKGARLPYLYGTRRRKNLGPVRVATLADRNALRVGGPERVERLKIEPTRASALGDDDSGALEEHKVRRSEWITDLLTRGDRAGRVKAHDHPPAWDERATARTTTV